MPLRRRSYCADYKLQAVRFAAENGNRAAGRKFGVSEKLVRNWRKAEEALTAMKKTKKANRGLKPRWPQLEEQLLQWVLEERAAGRAFSALQLRLRAQVVAAAMNISDFVGGPSWCYRFMQRNRVSLRARTTMSQTLAPQLPAKDHSFGNAASEMDETDPDWALHLGHSGAPALESDRHEWSLQQKAEGFQGGAEHDGEATAESGDEELPETDFTEDQDCHHSVVEAVGEGAVANVNNAERVPEAQSQKTESVQSSVLHCMKEEPEEVEIKAEGLPQFLHVSVKSEEGEPQSSVLHQTVTEENREDTDAAGAGSETLLKSEQISENSSDTDDSEDWAPSAERPTPQTQSEANGEKEGGERCSSDSESSWDFNPPAKTQARPKRRMEDLVSSICGTAFKTTQKVVDKRPFKCSHCGKCYITKCHLKRHMKIHTAEYTWRCPVCAEVLKHKGHLRLHMRTHSTDKQCSVCAKRFPSVYSCKRHMRTHTKEKPVRIKFFQDTK